MTINGIASPTIQSRYANIAMFISYQHNQFHFLGRDTLADKYFS
jgi:hypothetical protein